jgi:hypothetical protein
MKNSNITEFVGLARLFDTVKRWLTDDWPFENLAFPGREIDWKTWRSLLQ